MAQITEEHDAEFVPCLDRLATEVMADWKVPGAALAVVRDGKTALTRAYGQRDVEANLPVTTTTQFLICSITKSFTATAVALLHDEVLLDWTRPVRDLLCRQTGLPRHDWLHIPGDRSPAELFALMRYLEPSQDIRAAWQYNNLCYNVAGLLIERLSGQSYEDFIRARLTDRLGIAVAVLTNRSPSDVPTVLTWYIIDRLRGRDPVDWRTRARDRREEWLAHLPADKAARENSRHKNTRPAHALADYSGAYEHPAYGAMSVEARDGALHWSWRGMFATMTHRHYETFALPEVADRLMPDNLAITFLTDRDGHVAGLSAPLEPMVKDIVFQRLAAGDCTDAAFRKRCAGCFRHGATTHRVTLDAARQLLLRPDNQSTYRLLPQEGSRFRIAELDGFFVEFRGDGTMIDTMIFHQPDGTFVATRVDEPGAAGFVTPTE